MFCEGGEGGRDWFAIALIRASTRFARDSLADESSFLLAMNTRTRVGTTELCSMLEGTGRFRLTVDYFVCSKC